MSLDLIKLKQEIALLILDKLENVEITPERAAQIAKFVLKNFPENLTDEQVRVIIPKLGDQFHELVGVVHKHLSMYEEGNKDKKIKVVNTLIKQALLDQVQNMLKQHFTEKNI